MKRLIFLIVFASVVLLPASASAGDWKQWLKNRVPGVAVTNPLTGKTVFAANGQGAQRSGGDRVIVTGEKSDSYREFIENYDDEAVVIVPPDARSDTPSFGGTIAAINWFHSGARIIELENKISDELRKRRASFAFRNDGGNPCAIGRPVICFVVGYPTPVSIERRHDRYSTYSRKRRRSWSSSDSSSSTTDTYIVGVWVWLHSPGGTALLLGSKSEKFASVKTLSENWRWNSSRRGHRAASSGSVSSRLSNPELVVLSDAARKAQGIINDLLKNGSRKHWTAGAAEMVDDAFQRNPADSTND